MKLTKIIQVQGLWWIPGKPEKRFNGTLEINRFAAITLELVGDLGVTFGTNLKNIYGQTQDGKLVSLWRCFMSRRTYGSGATINAQLAFFGVHTEDPLSII